MAKGQLGLKWWLAIPYTNLVYVHIYKSDKHETSYKLEQTKQKQNMPQNYKNEQNQKLSPIRLDLTIPGGAPGDIERFR